MRAAAIAPALTLALVVGSCAVELPDPPDSPGDLVITEVAAEPEDGRPEWIELLNATDEPVFLDDCFVRTVDGDNPVLLELPVEPGQRIILADQADLTAEVGELRADAILLDLSLRHSTADELIQLFCAEVGAQSSVVAEATYNWSEEGIRQGHTRQLVEDAEEETWCEAPTSDDAVFYDAVIDPGDDDDAPVRQVEYGTPGAPALCDAPAGETPSLAGQILFTEVVPDDAPGAIPEWFELTASPANDGPLDLRGCQILDAPHLGDDGTLRTHVLDPERGTTGVAPGERLLLAKANAHDAAVDGFLVADGTIEVDYFYPSISLSNSGRRTLSLACSTDAGTVTIDSVSFNWSEFDGDFEGHSLRLTDSAIVAFGLDASVNDRPAAWCVADVQDIYAEGDLPDGDDDDDSANPAIPYIHYGTPGEANGDCPTPAPWPREGQVIFTEIMGNPVGSEATEEWFELHNTTAASLDLDGCRVENNNFDQVDVDTWPITGTLEISGDGFVVVARSTNGDFWACVDEPAARYTSIGLNNSDPEDLVLICPDGVGGEVVVDRITYDSNLPDGVSLQAPQSRLNGDDNDDTTLWCSLPAGDPAYTFSCLDVDSGDSNYGTPGEGPNCP